MRLLIEILIVLILLTILKSYKQTIPTQKLEWPSETKQMNWKIKI